jgi:hypothetical protein
MSRGYDDERGCTCANCQAHPYLKKHARHLQPGMLVTTTRWLDETPLYDGPNSTHLKYPTVTNATMLLVGVSGRRALVHVLGNDVWGWVHLNRLKKKKQ